MRVLMVLLLTAFTGLLVVELPELARYLKMKRM